jgi:hypothetical protein
MHHQMAEHVSCADHVKLPVELETTFEVGNETSLSSSHLCQWKTQNLTPRGDKLIAKHVG